MKFLALLFLLVHSTLAARIPVDPVGGPLIVNPPDDVRPFDVEEGYEPEGGPLIVHLPDDVRPFDVEEGYEPEGGPLIVHLTEEEAALMRPSPLSTVQLACYDGTAFNLEVGTTYTIDTCEITKYV